MTEYEAHVDLQVNGYAGVDLTRMAYLPTCCTPPVSGYPQIKWPIYFCKLLRMTFPACGLLAGTGIAENYSIASGMPVAIATLVSGAYPLE